MQIKITPNDRGNPPGKLAEAEIYFDASTPEHGFVSDASLVQHLRDVGEPTAADRLQELTRATAPLAGLKLIGFGIWERGRGGRNVTFPARQYSVNGERRSFALLRPITDTTAQERIRAAILEAYAEYERASDSAVDVAVRPAGRF
jgi:hypothetical protein